LEESTRVSAPRARGRNFSGGTGCEVVEFAQRGAHVTANEIDPVLKSIAMRRAGLLAPSIRWTAHDWRNLSEYFEANSYDLVLLLGNSFALLPSANDRELTACNIEEICGARGIVVVDVRNFQYILSERNCILDGDFRYSRRVIYCGTKIEGRPIAISDQNVRFGYLDGDSLVGSLDMVPLSPADIVQTFANVGFRLLGIYSDLDYGFQPNADFYSLVFEKP
jgi:SAM-dependent methyltransferase